MNLKRIKLASVVLAAPLAAACARQDNRVLGPPVPAPLTVRQAAEVARASAGGDADVEPIDCLSDGQLFGVTSRFDSQGRPFRESSLLFVHNDGTVTAWPGR